MSHFSKLPNKIRKWQFLDQKPPNFSSFGHNFQTFWECNSSHLGLLFSSFWAPYVPQSINNKHLPIWSLLLELGLAP
uniref:Uncharacterized protein n=1 Tax=Solanum tuberosum TaxID=4113 RepID=M1B801_SOLTU